ncbi:MAG: prenyltransferase/squalene oxidase repeat-containing protein [Planctomycetota bacterium]
MSAWSPFGWAKKAVRNSPWFVIAIALHVIVVAFAAMSYMRHEPERRDDTPSTIYVTERRAPPLEEIAAAPDLPPRHAIPPPVEGVLTDVDLETFVLPTDAYPIDLTQEIGDPTSLEELPSTGATGGTSIGVGEGGHHNTGGGPSPHSTRTPGPGTGFPPRGSPIDKPPIKTEKAVLEGFRWLVRHQLPDGSWSAKALRETCRGENACCDPEVAYSDHYDVGLTSLAVLAFLGAGVTHESKVELIDTAMGERHKLGYVVKSGLQWLAKRQQPDGSFSERAFLYNEALATLAFAEAYGLSRNRYWKDRAQRAVDFLVRAQKSNPSGQGTWGWRYSSRAQIEQAHGSGTGDESYAAELRDADTSVTAWAVMALKSAELAGLEVPRSALDGALAFVQWVTPEGDSGLVGYLDPKSAGSVVTGPNDHFVYHTTTMSALGMCIRIFGAHDPEDPFLERAARRLVADLPAVGKDKLSIDYYYWYYGSLALNQLDGPTSLRRSGKYWPVWNAAMVETLLALQDDAPRACSRGGWLQPDRWSYTGGPIYATALNVLTLEVYYRYENAFGAAARARKESVPPPDAARPKMVLADSQGPR